VGADHRGPLAAFVVIAIIAAVLLVTSVRSQAAPAWLDPGNLSSSVVAAPPVTDPHVWVPATSPGPQVIRHGVALVKQVTSAVATSTVDTSAVEPADQTAAPPRHAAPRRHGEDSAEPSGGQSQSQSQPESQPESPPHDHGHHHGWGHGHGHGHAQGHGHAHGQGH
jgi:hypothetical protein